MKSKKNSIIYLILSIINVILLNIVFGSYYVSYERFFYSLSHCEFTSTMTYSNNYNVWFLLSPIITLLSKYTINIYDIINIIILMLNFSIIYFNISIYLNINKKIHNY